MSYAQTTRLEKIGRFKSNKKPYKQETTIRPKILGRRQHINRPAANGVTTYKHNKMEKDLLAKSQSANHHHPDDDPLE